jgi:hypothetical protein
MAACCVFDAAMVAYNLAKGLAVRILGSISYGKMVSRMDVLGGFSFA